VGELARDFHMWLGGWRWRRWRRWDWKIPFDLHTWPWILSLAMMMTTAMMHSFQAFQGGFPARGFWYRACPGTRKVLGVSVQHSRQS